MLQAIRGDYVSAGFTSSLAIYGTALDGKVTKYVVLRNCWRASVKIQG